MKIKELRIRLKKINWEIVLTHVFPFFIAIIFATVAISSISHTTATTDEKFHLTRGIMLLETGDLRINQHHPILFNTILALPTQFDKDLVVPAIDSELWEKANKDGLSTKLVELNGGLRGFTENVLYAPRILIVLISSAFLVLFYYLLKSRFGVFIAIISLLLLATSPTYLAHSRLVTTDIPATITIFLSTIALYDYFKASDKKRFKTLLIFILAYFIALITKYSAVTLVAVYMPLIILDEILRRKSWKLCFTEILKKGSLITFSILIMLTAVYQFKLNTLQDMQYGNETKIQYTYNDINRIRGISGLEGVADGIEYFYENVKIPFPQYINGFYENVINHNIFGHSSFFIGERGNKGWKSYFPISYILKENIFTVIATAFSLLLLGWYFIKKSYIQKSWAKQITLPIATLVLTPSLLLFLSIESSLNLGIRYLLPIYPFIAIAIALVTYLITKRWKKMALVIFVLGITLNILSLATNYPDYISYFNETIDPMDRYLYLRDSSLDWHQNDLDIEDKAKEYDAYLTVEEAPPNSLVILSKKYIFGNPDTNTDIKNWLQGEYFRGRIGVDKFQHVTHVMVYLKENPYYEGTTD